MNDWVTMDVFVDALQKERHTHTDVELLYVMEGEINVAVEEVTYRMKKDDILVINAGKSHSVQKPVGMRPESLVCCIHISSRLLCEYTGKYRLVFWCNTVEDSTSATYKKLRTILNNLLMEYVNGNPDNYFYRYSLYYDLLHGLVNYYMVTKEDFSGDYDHKENDRIEDILQYIEINYNQEISLQDLADRFYLSVSYLSKYLKKKLGKNFVDYLYEVRMRYAVEELLYTKTPITHIALNHGYPSIGAFNRQFKDVYQCTPSQYRQKFVNDSSREASVKKQNKRRQRINERLLEHFNITPKSAADVSETETVPVHVDVDVFAPMQPVWNQIVTIGEAGVLLGADERAALLFAHKALKNTYVRFWGLFYEAMQIGGSGQLGKNSFGRLNQAIDFLLENDMKPMIELGEKPRRILSTPMEFVMESGNTSRFHSYDEFLRCFEALLENLESRYGRTEVESWLFELWEDKRVEVYPDKVSYIQLYQDCRQRLKQKFPRAKLGGAGNYLGWYPEHTDASIRKWIDGGTYPDFLTYTYYPYAAGEIYQERFSKRKTDEDDFIHSINELNQRLLQYGFPSRDIIISDWNMTMSSRNYFNDSLWKGCYLLKCSIEALGKVNTMVYNQLIDSTTDYQDTHLLLNGSGGLLNRDMIRKPAFIAMEMLQGLYKNLVAKGENYIITCNENQEYAIILFNFIRRNYQYYIKKESENTVWDHYQYFDHQNSQKVVIWLENLPNETVYVQRQYVVNRENGSIMDEWQQLSCVEIPSREDINYLKQRCMPKALLEYREVTDNTLKLEFVLQPLEMRSVILKRM